MSISRRSLKLLKYLKKKGDVFPTSTPFEHADFNILLEQHYVNRKDVSVPQGPGEYPLTQTAYYITSRGKDAIKEYRRNSFISIATLVIALLSLVLAIAELLFK